MSEPATAACERHARPLLDQRKVAALIALFDWPLATVEHACERELTIKRFGEDVEWSDAD